MPTDRARVPISAFGACRALIATADGSMLKEEVAMKSSAVPDGMPVLSRGRHRTPRHGACYMELASLLAGEPWSDHPACTHPLLAQLAQRVNDRTSDAGRQQLLPLIPSVVGRRGNDHTWLTLAVAVAASPILDVPEATQRVLAAGLLRAEQLCTQTAPDLAAARQEARRALELVPGAVTWVERLGVHDRINQKTFVRRCAPTMVRCAVEGIVSTNSTDSTHLDRRLRDLLEVGIAACPPPKHDQSPAPACASVVSVNP
jgi:hypothetical protein